MPTVKKIFLYEDRDMPKDGWLHGCITCGTITSKTALVDFKYYRNDKNIACEIHTYLCDLCKYFIDNSKNKLIEFKDITDEMISYRFNGLLTS